MKKIILISTLLLFNCCNSQSRTELSDLKMEVTNELMIKNTTKQTDLEQTTGYPYYNTYKVDQYKYGEVQFVLDYPKEKKFLKSEIGFLVNNQNDNLLQGYFIVTKNFKESEALMTVLKKKYGEPKVISEADNAWPYSGYYWKATKDGFDILLEQIKSKVTIGQKETKGVETNLYFVKTGMHYGNMEDRETVLQSFITTHEK